MKKVLSPLFHTGCCAFSSLLVSFPVFAQDITPDGTTATDVRSPDGQNFDINGGDRAGGNLFHSFGNFGVPNGGSANFLNSPDVVNIINRVTGGKLSDIQGIISAQGAANLFLINPAGIVFGPNASLNIGGSFLGSTADSLVFPDGEFSAVNAEGKPLLTINAPIGLGIRDNPGNIINQSVANKFGVSVKPGQNITLVGGNLDFNGGKITAPGGTVNLGSLGAAGTVGLNENGSLTFPDGIQRGDITLKNGAAVNVRAGGNGFINVNAKNLTLSEGSELFAGIEENQGSADAVGGDITIDATDKVTLIGSPTEYTQPNDPKATEESQDPIREGLEIEKSQGTGIRNNVGLASARRGAGSDSSNAKGKGGNIVIKTGKLELVDVAGIDGNLYGEGTGSNISISATDISFNGLRSYIASSIQGADYGKIKEKASGTAGDINIDTSTLTLNGFAGISARVSDDGATGKAGNITIKASDRVTLNDGSFILSQVGKGAIGTGGNIAVDTKNISFTNTGGLDKSGIYADTQGEGNAGSIFIKASDTVLLDSKALLLTQVGQDGIGNAGSIEIDTGNLSSKGESQILADTKGKGNAGNISVKASDIVSFEAKSNITSQVAGSGIGNGGNIELSAKNINFNNANNPGSVALNSSTQGKGQDGNISQAGNIVLKATENINLDSTLFLSQVLSGGIGDAGNIEIDTGNLSLTNGSLLNSQTTGKGNAGDINVKATGNIDLSANSLFISSVGVNLDYSNPTSPKPIFDEGGNLKVGEGNAGNINIDTTNLNLKDSLLISNTQGKGNAGDININAKDTISLDGKNGNSLILSSVEIATSNQKPILNNEGIAFTGEGNAGNINITTNNLTLTGKREPKPKDCCKSLIISDTKGIGNAGNINIDSKGKISLDRDGLIISAVEEPKIEEGIQTTPGGEGQAGNITITTGDLNLSNQSYIIADTKNKGDAGNIKIDATGNISLDTGSKIVTATGSRGIKGQIEGNAGQIDITANSLSLNDFSAIGANTNRKAAIGEARDINLNIAQDLRLSNGSIISALTENDFNAGKITINAQNLELASGGKIVTGTDGKGSAGNINLNIAKDIKIDGSNPPEKPSANVIYDKYYPENENELNDTKIEFLFREKILKDLAEQKYTGLFAGGTDTSTGNTGTINIGASNLQLQNGGNITAAAKNEASGGNINIKANSVVADRNNNNIKASAEQGDGGKISIDTPTAWGWRVGTDNPQTSDVDATSNVQGKDGIVNITAPSYQGKQEVVESPQNVVEVEQIEAQACSDARNVAQQNTFAILGRGDVENGTQPLNSSLIRVSQRPGQESDKQSNHPQLSNPQQKPLSSDEIIPARGVAKNEKGQIVLTRYATPKATDRTPVRSPWCQARE